MAVIQLAEWAPDQPDLASATTVAENVIPRTAGSYGPLSALARYSANALPSKCLGLAAVQNVDEGIYLYAGTASTLFGISGSSSLTWTAVSPTTYLTGSEVWRFAQLRSIVLATNYNDPIQFVNMSNLGTQFATLAAAAPHARHIAVAKTFTIVANTSDPVGGQNPARIWWSAAGDPTNWPTPGSTQAQQTQSDYSDLNGTQGDITGLVANLASADCAIFFQRGVYRMNYVGPPDVFDFSAAENVRGTRASNAIVPLGALVYYLGEDGFYAFDGNTSQPIGVGKVDRWFFENFNQSNFLSIIGTADVVNKLVMWSFPSTQSAGGVPDMLLIYRWDLQRWSYGKITAQWMARLLSIGVTVEGLNDIGYTNVDTIPFSFDSPVWLGGAPQTGFIDENGYLAFFGSTNLQARIGTAAAQIVPDRLAFVQSVRPLVDGGSPTVSLSSRTNYFDTETFGADVPVNIAGECPQRSSGRYHRARVTIPAGGAWEQAFGVDVTAIPGGTR